jgi:type IX secretion system substrate protein/nidogen-like
MKCIVKSGFVLIALAAYYIVSAAGVATCKCTIPIDNSFQIAPMTLGHGTQVGVPPLYENNNGSTPAMHLPFNFCFYGQSYDSVFISNNGIVSFVKPIFNFIDSPAAVPLGTDTIIIAPFWANSYTLNNGGKVYYKITPTYMAVIWDSVRYAGIDVDGWNTFQLIISDGTDPIVPNHNNVWFCYPVMQWACSDSSGGFSGYGGTAAFVGVNKGDGVTYAQISTFALPGTDFYGPFSPYNGVDWLDFQSFTFNTCVSGNVIPPVAFNYRPECNNLYVCPCDTTATEAALGAPDSLLNHCDTVNMTAAFVCAVPGQNAVLSYTCTGALNIFSVYTSTANIFDTITVTAIPAFGDTGVHILNLIATDTVNHVQSTITYTIDVTRDCLTAGINEPAVKNDFSVYPNPADKNLTIKLEDVTDVTFVKMYDVLGSQVFSAGLNAYKTDIDVSGFAKGMYFIELFKGANPVSVKKIIIE